MKPKNSFTEHIPVDQTSNQNILDNCNRFYNPTVNQHSDAAGNTVKFNCVNQWFYLNNLDWTYQLNKSEKHYVHNIISVTYNRHDNMTELSPLSIEGWGSH